MGHDISDLAEGDEQILILRDRTIDELETEGDELQSTAIAEKEKLRENLENRKHKSVYSGYDDEEFSGVIGQKRSILSHYDEVIEGKRQKKFTIGASGQIAEIEDGDKEIATTRDPFMTTPSSNRSIEASLDYLAPMESSDYYTPEEAGSLFKSKKSKKSKKSLVSKDKKKSSRSSSGRIKLDNGFVDDNNNNGKDNDSMDVDVTEILKRRDNADGDSANYVDDDDLQSAITQSRLKARRRRNNGPAVISPEDIASQLLVKRENQDSSDKQEDGEGLVISDMTEFIQNLAVPEEVEESIPEKPVQKSGPQYISTDQMQIEEEEKVKDNSTTDARNVQPDSPSIDDSQQNNTKKPNNAADDKQYEEEAPIYEEPLISNSLGSVINLMKKRGWMEKPTEEQIRREKIQKDLERRKAEWRRQDLISKQLAQERQQRKCKEDEEDEERNHPSKRYRRGKADPMTAQEREEQRQRELENQDREYFKAQAERLKNYNPDVQLEYTDKSGRALSTKEAFNEMCYKFHGIQPGKNKLDKIKARLERENKEQHLMSGDSVTAVGESLNDAYKRAGSSHIVLSNGSGMTLSESSIKK